MSQCATDKRPNQLRSIHTVYVLSKEGIPLMPTRPAKAKWLLKHGRAKVERRQPFTIRLTYEIKSPVCQPVSLAIDDGETVGVAAIQTNSTHQRVVFAAQMRLRGREITDSLSRRRRLRRARRRRRWGRRQKRQYHTQALPPSIRADIDAKMRLVNKVLTFLPISEMRWEPLSFSMDAVKNAPKTTGGPRLLPPYLIGSPRQPKFAPRLGTQKRERLLVRDDKRCCVCSRGVTQTTAFFYRIGRPKRLDSYITLCKACSQKIQTDRCVLSFDPEKYSSLRGVGRVMHGKIEFGQRLKSLDIPIFLVNGWRTAQCRKRMNLPKSHINDAVAIASRFGSRASRGRGEPCLLMDSAFLVRLRARHQRKLFFENPGDRDIQKVKRGKSKSVRRRGRRKLYRKRYGVGGVTRKRETKGFFSEPFAPYEAIYVTKSGKRGMIKNRKILKNPELPAPKTIAKIFMRGDQVKTAEGRLAEVVTLFSTGKVGIRFYNSPRLSLPQRTARIPETLALVARGAPMQFIRCVRVANDHG